MNYAVSIPALTYDGVIAADKYLTETSKRKMAASAELISNYPTERGKVHRAHIPKQSKAQNVQVAIVHLDIQ